MRGLPPPVMTRAWLRFAGPMALAVFVACVWLNQALGEGGFQQYREGVVTAPLSHPLDTLRYPFAYLYRRAGDLHLYFEIANMITGRPSDPGFVIRHHGHLP